MKKFVKFEFSIYASNTCCDVACLTIMLPHNTTGCLHSHRYRTTQLAFSESPKFGGNQYTFHPTNEFRISQGNAVTFFRCDGQVHSHGYSLFILR